MPESNIVVTGGCRGIGRGIVEHFARAGHRVTIIDIDVAADLDPAWHIETADVRDAASVQQAVEGIERTVGPITVLVNSAGVLSPAPLIEVEPESWERQIGINLGGVFHLCKSVAPFMLERGHGAIVNVSSRLGLVGRANHAPYSASKFGVIGLTQSLALELAPAGIRVNAVCPGPIEMTSMRTAAHAEPQGGDERLSRIPLGRFGRPEDVANLVGFLASDQASYITGQSIAICGGLSIA